MNEQDEKLLKLYKNDLRKKRILVCIIIIFLIGGISLFYFYMNFYKDSNENIENTITTNTENNIITNGINEENTKEQEIDNSGLQNEVVEKTNETEINSNTDEKVNDEPEVQVEKNENKPIETSKEVKKMQQKIMIKRIHQKSLKIKIFYLQMDIQWKMLHKLHKII